MQFSYCRLCLKSTNVCQNAGWRPPSDGDSPCGGRAVGQERGAVALPSEAVSGLVVAGDHGLGLSLSFALFCHGPVPLAPSLLQPASSQTPFLQVDSTQLVVYG